MHRISGFHRIRHYGLFANAQRAHNIAKARALLNAQPSPHDDDDDENTTPQWLLCPACGAVMHIIELFEPAHTAPPPPHRGRDPP